MPKFSQQAGLSLISQVQPSPWASIRLLTWQPVLGELRLNTAKSGYKIVHYDMILYKSWGGGMYESDQIFMSFCWYTHSWFNEIESDNDMLPYQPDIFNQFNAVLGSIRSREQYPKAISWNVFQEYLMPENDIFLIVEVKWLYLPRVIDTVLSTQNTGIYHMEHMINIYCNGPLNSMDNFPAPWRCCTLPYKWW